VASVLFLDRDGVMNETAPTGAYVTDAAAFRLLPGVPQALAELRHAVPGLHIAVVTNQRGIARGQVSAATVDALHAQLRRELRAAGGDVDSIEVCPHEIDACDCRKPALGMFHRVLASFPGVDPHACAIVGDSASDMEAGHRLGARTYLVGDRARREAVRRATVERGVRVDEEADSLPLLVGDGRLVAWLRDGAPVPASLAGAG
jgi:D-glycero-D-manno-heptose 1,7-bisphosphate phosphatase